MRIGGPFPFGEGVSDVALAAGGIYYPPPGNYVANLGNVTVLQVFDGQVGNWRNACPPAVQSMPFSTDGFNWRLVNLSGVMTGARITNAGTGGTNGIGTVATGATITMTAPAAGRTATCYPIIGGSIGAVTVTQAGSGFLVPPRIIFEAPPAGGIRATGYATIVAGAITAVTVSNAGAGYTVAPACYAVPQPQYYQGLGVGGGTAGAVPAPGLVSQASILPGSNVQPAPGTTGALLTVAAALGGSGTLTGIGMTDYGAGYDGTHIPTFTFTGVAGGVAATAIMAFSVTSVTVGTGGTVYGTTSPIWMSSLGSVVTTASHYKDGLNNSLVPRAARGIATLSSGIVTAYTVEDPGFALQSVPVVAVMSTWSLATALANGTAVVGGVDDVSFLQNAVQ